MKALKFIINGEEQEIAQGGVKSILIDISSYSSKKLTATIDSQSGSVDDLVNGTYIRGIINTNIGSSGASNIIINGKEFNIIGDNLSDKGSNDENILARIIGGEFWILEVFINTPR